MQHRAAAADRATATCCSIWQTSKCAQEETAPPSSTIRPFCRRTQPNIIGLNNLATLYQKENDPRALSTAEHAYRLRPGEAPVLDTLGWIVLQQGDAKRAVALLQEAVAKAPQSTALRYHLAAGYVKAGDKAKARETLAGLLASDEAFAEREQALALQQQL